MTNTRISDLVLHNDHHVIALNKPCGMPVQDDLTGLDSLHKLAQAYSKRDLYLVHRVDLPCSGVVVFGKTRSAASDLGNAFASQTAGKIYLAVVPIGIEPAQGELSGFIVKTGSGKVAVTTDDAKGKKAVLQYEAISDIDNYTLLRIRPLTGRMHQIRVQLGAAGFPIKGDVKYGARRRNRDRSIHLHSRTVTLPHPGEGGMITIEAPLPDEPVWNAFGFS